MVRAAELVTCYNYFLKKNIGCVSSVCILPHFTRMIVLLIILRLKNCLLKKSNKRGDADQEVQFFEFWNRLPRQGTGMYLNG